MDHTCLFKMFNLWIFIRYFSFLFLVYFTYLLSDMIYIFSNNKKKLIKYNLHNRYANFSLYVYKPTDSQNLAILYTYSNNIHSPIRKEKSEKRKKMLNSFQVKEKNLNCVEKSFCSAKTSHCFITERLSYIFIYLFTYYIILL